MCMNDEAFWAQRHMKRCQSDALWYKQEFERRYEEKREEWIAAGRPSELLNEMEHILNQKNQGIEECETEYKRWETVYNENKDSGD